MSADGDTATFAALAVVLRIPSLSLSLSKLQLILGSVKVPKAVSCEPAYLPGNRNRFKSLLQPSCR